MFPVRGDRRRVHSAEHGHGCFFGTFYKTGGSRGKQCGRLNGFGVKNSRVQTGPGGPYRGLRKQGKKDDGGGVKEAGSFLVALLPLIFV